MDRLIAPNSVPLSGAATAPTSGTPQYAALATVWPPYQYNAIQEELIAILTKAGIAPNNQNNAQIVAAIIALAAPRLNIVTFTSSGTYTPNANLAFAEIWAQGPGGNGGSAQGGSGTNSAGGGGGGGGAAFGVLSPAQIGANQAVTIGTIGVSASSFGGFLVGNNGANGQAGTATSQPSYTPPGNGGSYGGTAALIGRTGQKGYPGIVLGAISSGIGGAGGASQFGYGGAFGFATDQGAAQSGQDFGAGGAGGGCASSTEAGGPGGPGLVIIREWLHA